MFRLDFNFIKKLSGSRNFWHVLHKAIDMNCLFSGYLSGVALFKEYFFGHFKLIVFN